MEVKVKKDSIAFNLKIKGIHDDIMRLEATSKTLAYGVPEYLKLIFDGTCIRTFAANGWSVTLTK